MCKIRRLLRHRWHDSATLRRALPLLHWPAQVRPANRAQRRDPHLHGSRPAPELPVATDAMPHIIRQRALAMFGKLRVWDTAHNNGVLIYLLLAERAIEIVADRGLDRHVSHEDWHAMIARMRTAFHEDRFEDGLTQALEEVSAVLVRHFPLAPGESHRNELPDRPIVE